MIAYMRDEEVFVTIGLCVFALVIVWLALEHHARQQRLRLIQRAMETRDLDELSRRAVFDALAVDGERSQQRRAEFLRQLARFARRVLFILGWLTLVIGGTALGGMLLFGYPSRYDMYAATIAVGVGFALVTLPLAMRELDARRA